MFGIKITYDENKVDHKIDREMLELVKVIVNGNSFSSLSKGCQAVNDLSDYLVERNLLERIDKPYHGCVKIVE